MKELNRRVQSFEEGEWLVDIITDYESGIYESWLCMKGYRVKHFMYGLRIKDISYQDFVLMIADIYQDFTDEYIEEVVDK